MNETNEHNPGGLTAEQYGAPEWRLLRKGEHVSTTWGDEVWLHGTWDKSQWTGHVVGSDNATYRRRVSPTLAIADQSARIAELERRVEEQAVGKNEAELDSANLRHELRNFGSILGSWFEELNNPEGFPLERGLFIARRCKKAESELSQLRAEVERLKTQLAEREEDRKRMRDALIQFKVMYPNSPHIIAIVDLAIRAARAQPEDGK